MSHPSKSTRSPARCALVLATTLLLAQANAGAAPLAAAKRDRAPVEKTDNFVPIARFPYTGGTEIAFSGRYAYATQMNGHLDRDEIPDQGGIRIFDIGGRRPKQVGFLHCPGNDNDITVIRPGLVALGYHTNVCGQGQGLALVDVSNPRRPGVLGNVSVPSSHTITAYPGKPFVYVSPGGLAYAGGPEQIVDVSDPRHPKIAATYSNNPNGCHDLSFHAMDERMLAFCAGLTEVQIWDVSDPLKPTTVAHIANPLIEYPHYAEVSPDGTTLVINDEAFVAHECSSGQSATGDIWIYDISNPSVPVPEGRFAPPRGTPGVATEASWVSTWCTSHQFSFTTDGNLVVPWFTGGTNLLDLSDPANPTEAGIYRPADAIAYSSQFHKGRVYINDMNRGFEVVALKR